MFVQTTDPSNGGALGSSGGSFGCGESTATAIDAYVRIELGRMRVAVLSPKAERLWSDAIAALQVVPCAEVCALPCVSVEAGEGEGGDGAETLYAGPRRRIDCGGIARGGLSESDVS